MREKNIAVLMLATAMCVGCAPTNVETNVATQSEINENEDENMGLGKLFGSIFNSKKEADKENNTENNETQVVIFGEEEETPTYEYDTPILPSDAPEVKVNGVEVQETASSVPTNLPDSPDAAWEMQNSAESEVESN